MVNKKFVMSNKNDFGLMFMKQVVDKFIRDIGFSIVYSCIQIYKNMYRQH